MKIFSDLQYLPPGQPHAIMLYPFLGLIQPQDLGQPDSHRFDLYMQLGQRYFSMVPLPEAEVIVAPGEWIAGGVNESIRQLADEASRFDKPLVIFFNNDSSESIEIKGSVIFRTSFYRSTRQPNEFAFPGWSEDFVHTYLGGQLVLRQKQIQPVIGYCGYTTMGPRSSNNRQWLAKGYQWLANRGIVTLHHPGARLRSRSVYHLSHSRYVQTNFVIRNTFWNGAILHGQMDSQVAQQSRCEFVQNMVESDYILCTRGAGNFSYRLYETLSCGRIPVFIDTDCVLPYDHLINWRDYCVWVEESELGSIAEKVAAFHEALSSQEFLELQRACRALWEEWLSPTGFFANFHRHF